MSSDTKAIVASALFVSGIIVLSEIQSCNRHKEMMTSLHYIAHDINTVGEICADKISGLDERVKVAYRMR